MKHIAAGLFALNALISSAVQAAENPVSERPDWRETYAHSVGMQAVIYGYPVVRNTMSRYGMVERPAGQVDSPIAGWYHTRLPATAADKYGRSVTENLLYSVA